MKPEDLSTPTNAFDAALDAALRRALLAPQSPAGFREQLRASLARAGDSETAESRRARLERERQEGLVRLEKGYLQLRRRTLSTFIGGALATGAIVALLFPLLKTTLGADAIRAVAVLCGLAGLVIGVNACLGRTVLTDGLERL